MKPAGQGAAGESGAGSVLVLVVVAVAVLLCGLLVPLYTGIAAKRAAAAGADAAALAAADALSGAIPGFPCELAEHAARRAGASLTRCRIEKDTAVVAVSLPILGIPIAASARAGPPPQPGRHAPPPPGTD